MADISVSAVIGLIAIVFVLALWVWATVHARRDPAQRGARGRPAERGDNSGGMIYGSPAQQTRRDEAPRAD